MKISKAWLRQAVLWSVLEHQFYNFPETRKKKGLEICCVDSVLNLTTMKFLIRYSRYHQNYMVGTTMPNLCSSYHFDFHDYFEGFKWIM